MSPFSPTTFGDLLKQLRKRAGLTQRELATAVGYSLPFISNLELNQRLPDVQVVVQSFVPALGLQDDPAMAAHLIERAAAARGQHPPASIILGRTVQVTIREESEALLQPLPLIGRTAAIKQISNRLLSHHGRLLTLIGLPGVGKTALALAVANRLQGYYPDGVVFVSLAAVSDATLMASTITATVGCNDASPKPPKIRLIEFLRRKSVLLVLDNLEQITGAALLIAELLAACPRLCVLATSRERLHLRAEQRYNVPALDLADAVELFTQRAQLAEIAFDLTPHNHPTIEAICEQLDRLPLALELCAPQIERFSPAQLLAELQAHPLDLLVDGAQDLPLQHRTLRAAIERSYQLLDEERQRLFRTLGVFVGGFDLAAFAHFGFSEEALRSLISKSLVHVTTHHEPERRFVLLETLRAYAIDMLITNDEYQAIQQRHARYFLTMAENAYRHLVSNEEQTCYQQLEREHDNLRAVLDWSLTAAPAIALDLAGALHQFWREHGYYTEGRTWLTKALSQNAALVSPARGRALGGAGRLALNQGDYEQATALFEENLYLYHQLDDQQGIANALNALGLVALYQNDLPCAQSFLEQSLSLRRTINEQNDIAASLNNLGLVAMFQGDFDQARMLFTEKLAIHRANNYERGIALTLGNLGYCELYQGAPDAAMTNFITSMKMALHFGDRESLTFYLEGIAAIVGLHREGRQDKQRAASLLGAADALRKRLGAPLPPMDQDLYERTIAVIRNCLDDDAFVIAWTEGQAMTVEAVVNYALDMRSKSSASPISL